MKNLRLIGPAVMAAIALSAVTAPTASAACKRTFSAAEGGWANSNKPYCSVKEAGGGWAKVTLPGTQTNIPGVVCAKVEAGEAATWSDAECEKKTGTREYVLVWTGNWLRNEAKVKPAAVIPTAKIDATTILHIPAVKVKVECKGPLLTAEDPEISEVASARAKSVVFEGCATVEPATKCELEKTTIATEPVEAILTTGTSPADSALVKPETKTTFAKLDFKSSNTCVFNEAEPVVGVVTARAPTGQNEEVLQAFEGMGSVENNSLQVAGDKAFIEGGKALLALEGSPKWGFY